MKIKLGNGVVDVRHIELAIKIDENEVDLHLTSGRIERVTCAYTEPLTRLHTERTVDELLNHIHELEALQRQIDVINSLSREQIENARKFINDNY